MAYYVSQYLCLYSLNSGDTLEKSEPSQLTYPPPTSLLDQRNPKPSPSPLLNQASSMALSYTPTSLGLTSTQRLCKERTSVVVRSVSKAGLGFRFCSGLVHHSFRNKTILPFAASHEESVSKLPISYMVFFHLL